MKTFFAPLAQTIVLLAASLVLQLPAQAQPSPELQTPVASTYYPGGLLKQQVEQTRSRRVERSFYPSGVMQREQIWAMNGATPVKERDVTFSSAGVMLHEQRWAAGEPVTDLEFLVTGLLVSRKEYIGMGATRELLVQTYFSSGVLASEERFAVTQRGGQRPIGAQKKFDTSGRLISERTFDEDGRLTLDKAWSASGELMPAR